MALSRCNPSDYYPLIDRQLMNLFDDWPDRPLRSLAPYWLNIPLLSECNIGNSIGKVLDTKDKFGVEVDVSQFRPNELTVNVRERSLVIEGHHEERNDQNGSIERHFVRKFKIPEDVHLDSIESHLSDNGVLCVCAKKASISAPPARNIPIKAANNSKK